MREAPVHGLARHPQVLDDGLLVSLQKRLVHDRGGGHGLAARIGERLVPLLGYVHRSV